MLTQIDDTYNSYDVIVDWNGTLKQIIGQKSKRLLDIYANPLPNKTKMMPIMHALQKSLLKPMLSRNCNWPDMQFLL